MQYKTFRFRDFTIYKEAKNFRGEIRHLLKRFPTEKYRLIDQIDRSALSVVLNIAEGSAKKSDKEFFRFLETAIASLNEVIAGLDCALDDQVVTQQEMSVLEEKAEQLAKKIGAFMKTLHTMQPTAKLPTATQV